MSTLTLTHTELRRLLSPMVPLTGVNEMRPVLQRIAVATVGRDLVSQATDMEVAGFQRVTPIDVPPEGWSMVISARDATELLRLYRPLPGSEVVLTLTSVPGADRVVVGSASAGLELGTASLSAVFRNTTDAGKFTDLSSILSLAIADITTPDVPRVAMFPVRLDLLARFRSATNVNPGRYVRLHMPTRPARGLLLTVGRDFIGIVMPHRGVDTPEVTPDLPSWLDAVPLHGVNAPRALAEATS